MASLLLMLVFAAGDLGAAEQALAKGNPAEALDLLGDLAEQDEVDVRVHLVAGRALFRLHRYREAVEPLLRASEKLPDDKALAREAALACWQSADGVYAKLYLEDAKRLAHRADDAMLLADLDFAGADWEAALAKYRALTVTDANRLTILLRIADCLRNLGRDGDKAVFAEALEEALRRQDLRSAFRAAFAAGRGGRLLTWLDEQVKAHPDNEEYRLYRGYVRTELLMYVEAIEDLRAALEKRPDSLAIQERLAHVLLQHGVRIQDRSFIEESARLCGAILDRDPKHRGAWDRLGWIAQYYWSNNDVPRSYTVLKRLNAVDPDDIITALNFAAMARRLKHYDECRAVYDHLLELSPDDPAVLVDYAILVDGMGDRARAVEFWEKALEEESDNLNALENLLTHHWERGHTKEIEQLLARGLKAARERNGAVDRWLWFRDRLAWAPSGFGE